MSEINKAIMKEFPRTEEVPEIMRREEALLMLGRVAEAGRAAIDEITSSAKKTLAEDEQLRLGSVSEQLASLAVDVSSWQTNTDT